MYTTCVARESFALVRLLCGFGANISRRPDVINSNLDTFCFWGSLQSTCDRFENVCVGGGGAHRNVKKKETRTAAALLH